MKRKSLSFFVKITLFKKKKEKKGKNTNINNNKNAQDQRKRRHHRIKRWFFIFWYGDMMIPLSCPLSSFYKYIYILYIQYIFLFLCFLFQNVDVCHLSGEGQTPFWRRQLAVVQSDHGEGLWEASLKSDWLGLFFKTGGDILQGSWFFWQRTLSLEGKNSTFWQRTLSIEGTNSTFQRSALLSQPIYLKKKVIVHNVNLCVSKLHYDNLFPI